MVRFSVWLFFAAAASLFIVGGGELLLDQRPRRAGLEVGSVESAGASGDALGPLVRQRAEIFLDNRTDRLNQRFGYLQLPPPQDSTIFGAPAPASDVVKLEVQQVDVSGIIQRLRAWFNERQFRVTGSWSVQTDRIALELVLSEGGKRIAQAFEIEYPRANEAVSSHAEAMKERLVDRTLFRVIHAGLQESPALQRTLSRRFGREGFVSARARESFMKGVHHLDGYLATHHAADLRAARQHFADMRNEDGYDVEARMLLGITLAEGQEHALAAEVFKDLLELASDTSDGSRPRPSSTLIRNARLFHATSLIKQYTPQRTKEGLDKLDELLASEEMREPEEVARSEEASESEETRRDRESVRRTHVQAQIQRAWAHALYLAYLRHSDVDVVAGAVGVPLEPAADLMTRTIDRAYQNHRSALSLANIRLTALENSFKKRTNGAAKSADGTLLSPELQREQVGLERLRASLEVVEGNGLYRRAGWFVSFPLVDGDGLPEESANGEPVSLRSMLAEAAQHLQAAERRSPADYLALEYLGMIYADPQYDSKNQYAPLALDAFERAAVLSAGDYYAREYIARVTLAEVGREGWASDQAVRVQRGLDAATEAIELQPSFPAGRVARAGLNVAAWSVDPDSATARLIDRDLAAASARNGQRWANYWEVLVQWRMAHVKWSPLEQSEPERRPAFDRRLSQLRGAVDEAVIATQGMLHNDGRRLNAHLAALRTALLTSDITLEDRHLLAPEDLKLRGH